ncbi:Ephrin type-B receptor 4, partial [Ophiophagus hannah]
PQPVSDIQQTSVSPSGVTLTWPFIQPPTGNILDYEVKYYEKGVGGPMFVKTSENRVTLSGLRRGAVFGERHREVGPDRGHGCLGDPARLGCGDRSRGLPPVRCCFLTGG